MAVVARHGEPHRRDASPAPLADRTVEAVEGKTGLKLCLAIALDLDIALPQPLPQPFVRLDQVVNPLADGVDDLAFRFVPRVVERLRRADAPDQRETGRLPLAEHNAQLARREHLARPVAEEGRGGDDPLLTAVVTARSPLDIHPAPVLAAHRPHLAQRVGKDRGDRGPVCHQQFGIAIRLDTHLRHQRVGHVAQRPDPGLDRQPVDPVKRGMNPAAEVNLLPFGALRGVVDRPAVDPQRQAEGIDPLEDTAHRGSRARFTRIAQQELPQREELPTDRHAQFAVGHGRRMVVARRIPGRNHPAVVVGSGRRPGRSLRRQEQRQQCPQGKKRSHHRIVVLGQVWLRRHTTRPNTSPEAFRLGYSPSDCNGPPNGASEESEPEGPPPQSPLLHAGGSVPSITPGGSGLPITPSACSARVRCPYAV